MNKLCSLKRNSGFTLVELLVVISIISILAGTVFIVINPATQQRKAKEAVLKAKTSQLCLALNACGATKDSALLCDTEAEIGVPTLTTLLDPPGASYTITPANNANDAITINGYYPTGSITCQYYCDFQFLDGKSTPLTKGAACL